MYIEAKRLILETDEQGRLLGVPQLPPCTKVEAIFLLLPETPESGRKQVRSPPAELVEKVKIHGDIVGPTIPIEDWDMLK